jgi:nucleotide-binding universal stress UspA family protein
MLPQKEACEMALNDVLVALTTYPEPAADAAIDDAVDLAAALGARISAVACAVAVQVPGTVLGHALLNVPALAGAESRKSGTHAEHLLGVFQQSAERRGVFAERILEHGALAEVSAILVGHARLHDLTIVPLPAAGLLNAPYAEAVIFGSGRPTIVMPHDPVRDGVFALDTAVVAWDFSRPAARALADALPVLAKARRVHVVTVTNEKAIESPRSLAELGRHLARHGIDATLESVDAAGRPIGQVLDAFVRAHDADLLVMGAYGHSRVREFVLGGATKSVLARPSVPTLLSH